MLIKKIKNNPKNIPSVLILALLLPCICFAQGTFYEKQFPSWVADADATIVRIVEFVKNVTDESHPNFVPERFRIAVFDIDGTILCERPFPASMEMALRRLEQEARETPELREQGHYRAALERDRDYIKEHFVDILLTAFQGWTQDDYMLAVQDFLRKEKHFRLELPYGDLFYKPVLEFIQYLKEKKFKVYLVSGSWHAFVRSIAKDKIGLEGDRAIGTRVALEFRIKEGKAAFIRQNHELTPVNLRMGKAVNIWAHIGEPPILAMGNSRGDREMFEYTDTNPYTHMILCLNHDDADREFQYAGRLNLKKHWISVSMKRDFRVVFEKSR